MHAELKNEIIALLNKGTRLDGRKPDEFRDIQIEFGPINNAHGSCRVKIGDTEVLAGIKMEVMKPYSDAPDVGSMMVNVELFPMSSPNFESGPPSIEAIEMARITDRCIRESKMINVKKLCITEGEKAWMIVIDVCTVNEGGNLFDAVPLAALGAIKDCKLPVYDGEKIDYKTLSKEGLPIEKNPVSITVYKYGDKILLDPTYEEEKVYDGRLTVGVQDTGNLCSLQKGGNDAFTYDQLMQMVELARQKAKMMRDALGK